MISKKDCGKCRETTTSRRSLCREHFNEYYREYREKNLERVREIHRNSRKKMYKDDEKKRIRTSANTAVRRAIKKGELMKKPCKYCGKKAQAHHNSDPKKDWLNVTWLCVEHHAEWHRNNKPKYDVLSL